MVRIRSQKNNQLPLARLGICLVAALLLCGCSFPSPPNVTVTIKSIGGEDEAGEEDGGGDATTVAGYGNLVGKITYDGAAPELSALVNQGDATVKDPAVCSVASVPNESLQVDSATQGIANAVVFLAKSPKHIKPELASGDVEPAVFDQQGCKFFPHVLPVRVDQNQQVLVKSGDAIAHNTHTFPKKNSSFNQAIGQNDREGVAIKYTRAENEPIRVTCDYHSWMSAYHFPVDHPYFAITKPDGSFRIEGLPAGKHVFKIWQERGGLLERNVEVEISPDQDTTLELAPYSPDKFQL